MGWSVSSFYGSAARFGGVQYAVVDAWRDGAPIKTDLAITAGSVTDDSSPGVRRTLSLELFPELGLWDLLAPIGTELRPRSVVRYPSGTTETVPLGVYDIDAQSMSYGTGSTIRLAGSDKWGRIQRARFLRPEASTPGSPVTAEIVRLIRGALGPTEPVSVTATSTAAVGAVVWERDRDKAIEELAKSIGAYVSFDRNGTATVEDLPTVSPAAVWLVDASETGVLLAADRDRDRKRTYNVVVAASDKTDGETPFEPVIVWDNNPESPTYCCGGAGIGTWADFEAARIAGTGPFGVVPYFYTSPLLNDSGQAETAARTILARVTGMAAQLGLTAVRNHALDSLDAIDVLLPPERYDQEQPLERHLIDRVTHPLYLKTPQQMATRSTREDEFV